MSAQSNTLSKKERVNNIQAFIGLLLVVIGGFLPQIGLITKNGMLVLATFIAVLFGFSKNFSPWYVISAVLLYSIFSGASFTNTIFPAMISNNIIWMIVFTYWFIAAVQESGALRYLTKKLLSMPLAKKGPYGLMFILMIASWIGAALTQSMGGVLLLVYAILQDVANELELEKYNKWTVLTGIGCAIVGCMGNLVLPFGAVTLLYNSLFESTFGLMTMPSDGLWFLTYMLISIFVVAAFIIITKYLVRPNVNIEKFKDLKTVGVGGIKATKQAKIMLAMLVFIILILLLPSVLPSDFIISKICSNIGVTGAFGIGAFVGCFVQGDKLFNFNE